MSRFKPALVLAAIAAIVSALVIITYNLTYVDTSNIITDKQAAAAISIYGGAAEDYSVVPAEVWKPALEVAEEEWQPMFVGSAHDDLSRVTKVIKKNDGGLAFEVSVKGYKEGYTLLVGVDEGAVAGVSAVSTGEETKDLGTKTADPDYLAQFKGFDAPVTIVSSKPKHVGEIQAVTGATYSSKGVAKAVNIALEAYRLCAELVNFNTNGGGEAE